MVEKAGKIVTLDEQDKATVIETTGIIANALGHYRVSSSGMHCTLDWVTVCQLNENDTLLRLFMQAIEHEKGHRR